MSSTAQQPKGKFVTRARPQEEESSPPTLDVDALVQAERCAQKSRFEHQLAAPVPQHATATLGAGAQACLLVCAFAAHHLNLCTCLRRARLTAEQLAASCAALHELAAEHAALQERARHEEREGREVAALFRSEMSAKAEALAAARADTAARAAALEAAQDATARREAALHAAFDEERQALVVAAGALQVQLDAVAEWKVQREDALATIDRLREENARIQTDAGQKVGADPEAHRQAGKEARQHDECQKDAQTAGRRMLSQRMCALLRVFCTLLCRCASCSGGCTSWARGMRPTGTNGPALAAVQMTTAATCAWRLTCTACWPRTGGRRASCGTMGRCAVWLGVLEQ